MIQDFIVKSRIINIEQLFYSYSFNSSGLRRSDYFEKTINMNSKSRSFQFDAYSELIHSKLMFTKVMSQQDKKTGVLFPIPFEKDRIDFINSIFIKDKHRFIQLAMRDINGNKYFIIDDKKRFDLKWLYPKQHMNTLSSKVAVKRQVQ